jgi:uncharacterized metal-binding protein YceD (DUF177 family)
MAPTDTILEMCSTGCGRAVVLHEGVRRGAATFMKPEFSRAFAVDQIPADGIAFSIDASARELVELAQRIEVEAARRVHAEGSIRPSRGGVLAVDGLVEAELERICVVTLEPFTAAAAIPFERLFAADAPDLGDEAEIDPTSIELEPLEGRQLDVGEIAVEELILGLDPFPRSPAADASLAAFEAEQEENGPFAGLAKLRQRQ